MMAFIDDDLPVLLDQLRDRIVFLIDQALVSGNVDLPSRFLFTAANYTDERTLKEGVESLPPLIK